MWLRNLLFLVLVSTGTTVLALTLYPPSLPSWVAPLHAPELDDPSFHATVEKVDKAFAEKWTALDLKPAGEADDLAIIRRISLGLTGTVPSLEEIRVFEKQPAETRIQWWLSRLFKDRRYADYMAERLARVYVGTDGGAFILFRRRRFVNWLSDELMQNRPYDALARELLTAQGLWTDHPSSNFITATIIPGGEDGNRPDAEKLASRVSRAFLGIRLDCAQCHNHPFQSWKQNDYQGLAAFFAQLHTGFTGIYDGDGEFVATDRKTLEKHEVREAVPFLHDLLPEQGTRRERLAAWITHKQNPYFSRAMVNRTWALLFGRPMVEPVDDIGTSGEIPRALQVLADDFAEHDFNLHRLIRLIVSTRCFHLDSQAEHEITEGHESAWAAFPLTRLRPEQVVGGLLQACSIETIDQDSHIFTKLARFQGERQFVERYGDTGEDEFSGRGGTIPQRLLLMNGELQYEKTKPDLFTASARISSLAPDDEVAVEAAYLAVLTRRPTEAEAEHFLEKLAAPPEEPGAEAKETIKEPAKGRFRGRPRIRIADDERARRLQDIYWALLNSTEFSWNH